MDAILHTNQQRLVCGLELFNLPLDMDGLGLVVLVVEVASRQNITAHNAATEH